MNANASSVKQLHDGVLDISGATRNIGLQMLGTRRPIHVDVPEALLDIN
jgi:hypothetical protein